MEMIKVFNDHTGEILEKTFVDPADERPRPWRSKFPLYTLLAILSIGKLNKFAQARIPKVCAE